MPTSDPNKHQRDRKLVDNYNSDLKLRYIFFKVLQNTSNKLLKDHNFRNTALTCPPIFIKA